MNLGLNLSFGARLKRILSTKMLQLNGATSYGELAEPWVSTGDFEIEVVFSRADVANRWEGVIGDSVNSDSIYITFTNVGTIRFGMGGGVAAESTSIEKGKLITAKLKYTFLTKVIEGFVNGISQGTSATSNNIGSFSLVGDDWNSSFQGTIKSLKLTDLTTPSNSRTYTLDSGSLTHELPDGVSGDSTHPLALIYKNVQLSDWDDYYFNKSLGTKGCWVSKTGGDNICLS